MSVIRRECTLIRKMSWSAASGEASVPRAPSATLTLTITGMTCMKCVRIIGEGLRELDGVLSADVDKDLGLANITLLQYFNTDEKKKEIIDTVQTLVNGKFKAWFAQESCPPKTRGKNQLRLVFR